MLIAALVTTGLKADSSTALQHPCGTSHACQLGHITHAAACMPITTEGTLHLVMAGLGGSSVPVSLLRCLDLSSSRASRSTIPLCISISGGGPQPLQVGLTLCAVPGQAIPLLLQSVGRVWAF